MGVEGGKTESEWGKRLNEIRWWTYQTRKEIYRHSLTAIRLLLWWTKNTAFSHIHISSKRWDKTIDQDGIYCTRKLGVSEAGCYFPAATPAQRNSKKSGLLKAQRESIYRSSWIFNTSCNNQRKKMKGAGGRGCKRDICSASFPWVLPLTTCSLSLQAPFYLAKWCYSSGSPDGKKKMLK